ISQYRPGQNVLTTMTSVTISKIQSLMAYTLTVSTRTTMRLSSVTKMGWSGKKLKTKNPLLNTRKSTSRRDIEYKAYHQAYIFSKNEISRSFRHSSNSTTQ